MDSGHLLQRLRDGELDAIQAVLDQYGQALLTYLYRMLGDRWTADDLLQEIMVKLIQNAGSIRDEKSLKTWLYAVAHNHALGYLRHKKVERTHRPEPPAAPATPVETADRREKVEAVQRAIEQLEEPFKTAFILCEMQGMDHENAARVMECSLKTVSSRLYRAWEKMRVLLRAIL